MTDLSGKQLGPYELIEPIGRGGMATVYRARQPSMEREVAIKIIADHLAADDEFMRRFQREAQIIAQLNHPHIVPVYDFGRDNGSAYLVMRLIEGGNLATELRREGSLPVARVLRLTRQIASALAYAHQRGIVHRDLKPTNILLDADGDAYLTDFGIAKMLAGQPTTGLTAEGSVMGTPTYMAPEQWRAEPVDGRTDIYALGVLIYQMLLGQVPFAAETPHGLMYQHLDVRPPAPHTIKPSLPASIEPVIDRALAKNREDRYPSALDLANDLERVLQTQAPGRLPEQTLFDEQQAVDSGVPLRPERDPNAEALDDEIERDLMARAGEDDDPDLQPTIPPTQPPHYAEVPTVGEPTLPAGQGYSAPPPPAYEPPVYEYQPEPVVETPYDVPPVEEPRDATMERALWIGGALVAGIVLIVIVVLLGSALIGGDDDPGSGGPTAPPATNTIPAELRPALTIQSPADNTQVSLGDPVTIDFSATDREGITRVELRRFNIPLDTLFVQNQARFDGEFTYTPDSTGSHTLDIIAFRNDIPGEPDTITLFVR